MESDIHDEFKALNHIVDFLWGFRMKFDDRVYDVLKWICLVAIPALNTFLGVLLPAVNVPAETVRVIITVIAALGAFVGTLIGISTVAYEKETKE